MVMTIRDRIFDKLEELNMTQKEFSNRTKIPESTISDWRKKKNKSHGREDNGHM
jgi:DNA-binding transcriptional regulator YiaG